MRLPISKYYYLHPILHRFQDMADYLSTFGDYKEYLSLTHSFGVNFLNSEL